MFKGKAYERARKNKVYWFVEDTPPKCAPVPFGINLLASV